MNDLLHMIMETADDHRSLIPGLVAGPAFISWRIKKVLFPESTGAGILSDDRCLGT